MSFAILFPGQGSQSVNMLAELRATHSVAQESFAEATEALGYDLWHIISENPDDKLNKTEYTQPAMLAAGVATWRVWQSLKGPQPAYLAGHSLGEYTALVAAGSIAYADALRIVAERGRLMQAAVPEGQGAMAAILGLEDEQVRQLCRDAAQGDIVEAVNFNSPGQVVIAGQSAAVARAIELAKPAGAKMARLLPVSVPSHSSLMRGAAEKLAVHLRNIEVKAPTIPVLHNIDAQARNSAADIISALQQQLHSPVLWVDTIKHIQAQDIINLAELGPGKVLAGLCKRIDRELKGYAADTTEGMQQTLDAFRSL
ncbi:MAG: ACP S-malonyltransferase [Gammaproteobacteria bacterium]|nr:ACP S-malonyltransferase [Gammaproteobacteria bacterium]